MQRSISHDEYAAQLRSQLSQINAERDSLSSQLKAARKEANKCDAAKRSEIDALKRAAEKHASADTRSRQKARALQEAAKQASAAAREAEESAQELEDALPSQREHSNEMEEKHTKARSDWERSKVEAEEALRLDQKRSAELKTELSSLTSRLEKLQTKRDRLTNETLPELETQLSRLIREVERVERDETSFEVIDNGPVLFDFGSRTNMQRSPSARTGDSALSSPPPSAGRQPSASPFTSLNISSRPAPFDPAAAFNPRTTNAPQPQQTPARRQPSVPTLGGGGHSYAQSVDEGGRAALGLSRPVSPNPARQTSLPISLSSSTNSASSR